MIEKYLEKKLTKEDKQEITNIVSSIEPKVNTFIKAKNLICKNNPLITFDSSSQKFSKKEEEKTLITVEKTELDWIIQQLNKLNKEVAELKELQFGSKYNFQDFVTYVNTNENTTQNTVNLKDLLTMEQETQETEEMEIVDEQEIYSFSNMKIEDVFGTVLTEKPKRSNFESQQDYELHLKMWEYQEIFLREQMEELEQDEDEQENEKTSLEEDIIQQLNKEALRNDFRNEIGLTMVNGLVIPKYTAEEITVMPISFKEIFKHYSENRCPFLKDKKELTDYGKKQIITTFINHQGYILEKINPKTQTMIFKRKK